MAGIRRFITYIYAYENGKKGTNKGFAKIEIRAKECQIEIHLRGLQTGVKMGKAFLFRQQEDGIEVFPIGEMRMVKGNGDYGTIIKADRIGKSEYSFESMDGLLLEDDTEIFYATRWTNGEELLVEKERIRLWEPPRFDKEQPAEEKKDDLAATEMPMRNIYPKFCWADTWERMKKTYPFFVLPDGVTECVRIELKDLRELPRKHWVLGNNSFLLHGFFNYRHLILGRMEENRWFIGVPGIYQNQERVMAAIFGFPGFLTADTDFFRETDPNLSQEETEPVNRFGYWYHTLDE